jgi:hypothetical protein
MDNIRTQRMIEAVEAKRENTVASLQLFKRWLSTASAKEVLSAIEYHEEMHSSAAPLARDMLTFLNSRN